MRYADHNTIALTIGRPAAIELCRAWGGRALYVPSTMTTQHPIALTLGFEAASKLSAEWGGDLLHVPSERRALAAARDDSIVLEWQQGETISAIARRFGLSRFRVQQILDARGADRRSGPGPLQATDAAEPEEVALPAAAAPAPPQPRDRTNQQRKRA